VEQPDEPTTNSRRRRARRDRQTSEPDRDIQTPAGRRVRADRGLRDLVGAGPSQLGVSRAMRGRDLDRPTDAELAEAEREVQIVRRNWRPEGG
jgi:hypothetical protein